MRVSLRRPECCLFVWVGKRRLLRMRKAMNSQTCSDPPGRREAPWDYVNDPIHAPPADGSIAIGMGGEA
eukprot:scaffold241_cov242-Pinguiococcus_pyrenoidosus.AAC.15